MMRARGLILAGMATLCVLAGGLVLWSAPVFAANQHSLVGSFGGKGSGDGQFNTPAGVAVNGSTGRVYVVDSGNDRVEYFSAAGQYEGQFDGSTTPAVSFSFTRSEPYELETSGLGDEVVLDSVVVDSSTSAGDPSKGDVYVIDRGHDVIDKFNATGSYEGQLAGTTSGPFDGIGGVAIDAQGNVWVAEFEGHKSARLEGQGVDEFDDEGKFVEGGGFLDGFGAHGIAVDGEGDIYLAEYLVGSFSGVKKWVRRGGVWEGTTVVAGAPVTALALDQASGHLYTGWDAEGESVFSDYSSSGELLSQWESRTSAAAGMAVGADGTLYAADAPGDVVEIFAEGEKPETPVTEAATTEPKEPTTATFNGTLGAGSGEVEYYFSYDEGPSCTGPGARTTTPAKPPPPAKCPRG